MIINAGCANNRGAHPEGIRHPAKAGTCGSSLRGKAGLKREKPRGNHTSQASEKIHCRFETRLPHHAPT